MRIRTIFAISCSLATIGCAGLREPPALPEALQAPRHVALHLQAAPRLNVSADGQSLALVVRIYKLRQLSAFDSAPFAAFLDPGSEKQALGADLVEAREVTLVPGQQIDLDETVSREAGYIGVAALFRAPAAQRWRVAFPAAEAERNGVTVGLLACALSAGSGAKAISGPATMMSSVHCQ
ncbi:type VI secretion system lipoprotein TssJ [Massilia terrae]|uniref:Type VI secretion system lipoprotein TssJ n=1 Tax=Massilia terrae TaxID=1811224 RepID=A0ABT2CV47_9BURK|nr:type VI secretion system lipoprotein TssJ [Massilia terrae]MCS0657858.1 type VI secretion system lipoprotein TssJ [Massilia terrae]